MTPFMTLTLLVTVLAAALMGYSPLAAARLGRPWLLALGALGIGVFIWAWAATPEFEPASIILDAASGFLTLVVQLLFAAAGLLAGWKTADNLH